MQQVRRRVFSGWRRGGIIALLAAITIVAGIRFALPASAEAYICIDEPFGGGCIEATHVPGGTRYEGIVVDLVNDDYWTEVNILAYNSAGELTRIHGFTAHKPDLRQVDVDRVTPVTDFAMRLELCEYNVVDDRRVCSQSDLREI